MLTTALAGGAVVLALAALVLALRASAAVARLKMRLKDLERLAASSPRQPSVARDERTTWAPTDRDVSAITSDADNDAGVSDAARVASDLSADDKPESPPHVAEAPEDLGVGEVSEVADAGFHFSVESVREAYSTWCTSEIPPAFGTRLEIGALEYAGAEERPGFGGSPTHILRDAKLAGSFVRFAEPGAQNALVFPHPRAHFSPAMALLFRGLSKSDFNEPRKLGSIDPVNVRRRNSSEWEAG